MTKAVAARRGFSLIELLVVISIIAVLAGLLFPALGLLKRQQRKASTKHLMGQLQTALISYLGTYPILGMTCDATSSDFVDSPWTFLGRNPKALGSETYIDLLPKYLAKGGAAGPWTPATQVDGDQILDYFPSSDRSNHFVWSIINGQRNGVFVYTDEIWVRSTCGTQDDVRDDLIMHFTLVNGQWTSLNYPQARGTSTLPIGFGLGAYDPTYSP